MSAIRGHVQKMVGAMITAAGELPKQLLLGSNGYILVMRRVRPAGVRGDTARTECLRSRRRLRATTAWLLRVLRSTLGIQATR
jgi:hypothetical protein